LAKTPAEFVDQVMPAIRRAATALGLNPLGLLAQAALETGWGQRMARNADGSPSLNMFGVKPATGGPARGRPRIRWSSATAWRRSGARLFRAYGSIEESVSDFANVLKKSPRYRMRSSAGGDVHAYIDRIGKSGYATDPEYATKVKSNLE